MENFGTSCEVIPEYYYPHDQTNYRRRYDLLNYERIRKSNCILCVFAKISESLFKGNNFLPSILNC